MLFSPFDLKAVLEVERRGPRLYTALLHGGGDIAAAGMRLDTIHRI